MNFKINQIKGHPVLEDLGIHCSEWRLDYKDILSDLEFAYHKDRDQFYEMLAAAGETDFFLFSYLVLGLPINHPYFLARCYELQDNNDVDSLYLWGREHWKSTLINYARGLWRIVRIPDASTLIGSKNVDMAKPHFRQIKNACERNSLLYKCWPHIFHKNPLTQKDYIWSDKSGLYFKTTTEKDPAFGAYGMIDAMPTGGHFKYMLLDDMIDLNNQGTEKMQVKTESIYDNMDNLLSYAKKPVEDILGTRTKSKDLYYRIMQKKLHRVSIIPAVVDRKGNAIEEPEKMEYGYPVLMNYKMLRRKYNKQGYATFCAQMLQLPKTGGRAKFKMSNLEFYDDLPKNLGMYFILADPATDPEFSMNAGRIDYTCMLLLASGAGNRIYLVDAIRDRMSMQKKWEALKGWHRRYGKKILFTGYEEYATQKDREFFIPKMRDERFYFDITPMRGNQKTKYQRIDSLSDYFDDRRIVLPKKLYMDTTANGVVDFIDIFIEHEYKEYPNIPHDDILDTLARIFVPELNIIYPEGEYVAGDNGDENFLPIDRHHGRSPLETDENLNCIWGGW